MRPLTLYVLRFTLATLALLCALPARSATEITAYITITNIPAGLTSNLTVNIGTATTRYWTNNATAAPANNIQTTNTTAASVTNLLLHFGSYPVYSVGAGTPQALFLASATNTSAFTITAPLNTNLTVTLGGNWATLFYVTNTYADGGPVQWPTNLLSAFARTQALNAIVNYLAATNRPASNAIPPGAQFLKHYPDNTSIQTLSNKTLVGPILTNGRWVNATNITGTNVALTNVVLRLLAASGITELNGFLGALTNGALYSNAIHAANISNAVAIGGVAHRLTNGYWTNAVLDSPKATNLVSYSSLSAPGDGTGSEQFGGGAHARNDFDTAFGFQALATNGTATSVGYQSTAWNGGTAVGSSTFGNTNAVAIGAGARAAASGNIVIGAGLDDDGFSNVIAIGGVPNSSNQVLIGSSAHVTRVPGPLAPEAGVTNATWRGTNVLNGRLDLTPRSNSGLANGYNSGVVLGSNVYVRLSGPSAAYTNAGFAAEVDGSYHILEFANPAANLTFLNDSGLEATAANRITTGTGALVNYTNDPVIFPVIYNATAQRWRVLRALP